MSGRNNDPRYDMGWLRDHWWYQLTALGKSGPTPNPEVRLYDPPDNIPDNIEEEVDLILEKMLTFLAGEAVAIGPGFSFQSDLGRREDSFGKEYGHEGAMDCAYKVLNM